MPPPAEAPASQPPPADAPAYRMVVDGVGVEARSGRRYATEDPYRRTAWATVPDGDGADVDAAVAAARRALSGPWGRMTGFERGERIRRLGDLIARDADQLAQAETRDTGKLLREMAGQVASVPRWFSYFAGLADKLQGSVIPSEKPDFLVYTRREPVGVVGAILPWNSPLLLLCWKLAPALAAGCTFVAKPSEYTPVSALLLGALAAEAGLPPGVVNVVTGDGPEVGRALASHPGVDKVAFTGSTANGIAVLHSAADHLARVTLELGGKSAQVVFGDADLAAATNGVVSGIFAASGQTCMAGSRLLVHRSVHDELVERIARRAEAICLGDPAEATTEMGPLANRRQFDRVMELLGTAAVEGARVVTGGSADEERGGLFVRPTVVTEVTPTMTLACEEVFGPVLAVLAFDTEEEAIELANGVPYGLAASVWTEDVRRAHRVAHALRAGTVWVNAYRTVSPAVPFGGRGRSGLGRENGVEAIDEYTETKAVWVELSGATRDPFTLG